jgi:hypothetical protein
MHLVLTFRRLSAFVAILLFTGTAHSALLEVEPNIYRDTATNLEWLSLNETTTEALGLTDPNDVNSTTDVASIVAAVAATDYVVNQGFHIATSSEVTNLYAGSGGVFDFVDDDNQGPNIPLPDVFALGGPQSWDEGFPFSVNNGGFVQAGLHFGAGPGSFVYSEVNLSNQTNAGDYQNYIITGSSYTLNGTPDAEYWSGGPDVAYPGSPYIVQPNEMDVYLVRTVVPLPAAVYFLGSGLLVLLRFRRKN